MNSNKSNYLQDTKDLDKYIRYLVSKCAQVIVQSRLCEKIQTQCNPLTSGTDWFNIAINDKVEVLAETKKILNVNAGESITSKLPLSIEISLETVEGDKMILEVWSMGIIPDQADPTQRPTYAVYNRMGIILKSLIAITRVTPAYKLSRRQSIDSYHIHYHIYVGDPHVHNLGDGYHQIRVGQLSTSFGAINICVDYRTKMTISPTQTSHDNGIMLKSDHFLKDISPKHIRYHNKKNEKKVIDLDKPMKIGAFVDTTKTKQYTEADYVLPEHPPFSWLLKKPKEETDKENVTEDDKQLKANAALPITDEITSSNNNNMTLKNIKSGESTSKDVHVTATESQSLEGETKSVKINRIAPLEDERQLKELHFPFATNSPISDLAKFYRDCFNAPPLGLVPGRETPKDEDLSQQLEEFETSLGDYDTLVTSLCCRSVDNNSNS